MLSEGLEESTQEVFDTLLRNVIFGENNSIRFNKIIKKIIHR